MGRTTKPSAKLKIHVENEQLVMYGSSSESSGCVLRGALSLRLKKPASFKSLILSFQGTISVSWSQCKSHTDAILSFFPLTYTYILYYSVRQWL